MARNILASSPFQPLPGKLVIYGEWNGSEYDEYQAIIRSVQATPAGRDEPTINLAYSDGASATNANNVRNIELIDSREDYWRALFDPDVNDSTPPVIARPTPGQVVWLGRFNPGIGNHTLVLAFVRSVPGNPNETEPTLNLTYFDPDTSDSLNINQVAPITDPASETGSYWFLQREVL